MRRWVARLVRSYGRRNRASKLNFARRFAAANDVTSVLVVGVYPHRDEGANQIERGLEREYPDLVASGLEVRFGAWDRYVAADARRLPFADQSFDLVFSNAVIEHVGVETDQRRFIREHDRVGRTWIATTPNRFFPVEAHFHGLFTHWRRDWNVEGIRLLSRWEFRALLPADAEISGSPIHPTFTAYKGQPPP